MYSSTIARLSSFVHNYSHYARIPHPPDEARRLGASQHAACAEAHSPTPDLNEMLEIAALMRRSVRVVLLLFVRRPTSLTLTLSLTLTRTRTLTLLTTGAPPRRALHLFLQVV